MVSRSTPSSSVAAARPPCRWSTKRATGNHGVFVGATLSSETTAAAVGAVGVVRRDPMAMLPFIGYNAGDYVNHWLEIGKQADAAKLPKIYQVNWFRRDREDGSFLWPGFGDNARVLKWIIERLDGSGEGVDTPVGIVPAPGALDTTGLDMTEEQVAKALEVNAEEWATELGLIEEWLAKFGDKLPSQMSDELATLKSNLEN
jgi:phosphoenolpyruvate carboxykinase (GTP)